MTRSRRMVAGALGVVALVCGVGASSAAPAAADEARCLDYLHQQGFRPGEVNPSSYSIARSGCQAGTRGAVIICTSLINLATEEHNAAHPESAVDPWWACTLASWWSL